MRARNTPSTFPQSINHPTYIQLTLIIFNAKRKSRTICVTKKKKKIRNITNKLSNQSSHPGTRKTERENYSTTTRKFRKHVGVTGQKKKLKKNNRTTHIFIR